MLYIAFLEHKKRHCHEGKNHACCRLWKGFRMEFSRKGIIFTALKEEVGNTKSKESLLPGQKDNYCWQL